MVTFELFRKNKPDELTKQKRAIRMIFRKHTLPTSGDPNLTMYDTQKIINEIAAYVVAEKRGKK
jgi:hypothetical protein